MEGLLEVVHGLLPPAFRVSRLSTSPRHAKIEPPARACARLLAAYGAMTVGLFAGIAYLSTPERPVETEDDLAGLSESRPGMALLIAIFLFSLIGIPLTAGFLGKWMLFFGAMGIDDANARLFCWLALIGVINAAIGAWFYLRILAKMYLFPSVRPLQARQAWPGLAALWICAAITIALGIFPGLLVTPASDTTRTAGQQTGVPRSRKMDCIAGQIPPAMNVQRIRNEPATNVQSICNERAIHLQRTCNPSATNVQSILQRTCKPSCNESS